MKLIIKDILENDAAVLHNQGLVIYEIINKNIIAGSSLSLSFEGIKYCTTQFLNASIGKLYLNYEVEQIEQLLHFENISKSINLRLIKVIKNASRAEAYDKMIHEAVAEL